MNAFASTLVNGRNQGLNYTENGALTNLSAGNACLDLFFEIGASRGKDITRSFAAAYGENRETALRMALWVRDVRGGQGERQIFRDILKWIEVNHQDDLSHVLPKVAEVGRWDDLLVMETKLGKEIAFALIYQGLSDGNGLCAKWMPRQGRLANELAAGIGITKPGVWRRLVVGMSNTVEQKMCAKDWENINLEHVPSLATIRYNKAFERHIPHKMTKFAEAVSNGDAKVNASAVYPYDIVESILWDRTPNKVKITQAQWDNLPDFVPEGKSFVPMVDVSPSMTCSAGGTSKTTCMTVAIALGLYVAERNKSAFKDVILSFSSDPKLFKAQGSLVDRLDVTRNGDWGGSTNIEAAFKKILSHAKTNKVPQADMPDALIVFSDMEFDSCVEGGTAFQRAQKDFEAAGYAFPRVIFWNLNARGGANGKGNSPVTMKDRNTSLVSGFSPSTMQTVFGGAGPYEVMIETLYVPRYDLA